MQGDKTITFNEEEVNFMQSVLSEYRQSSEGQSSFQTEDVVQSCLYKLATTTPASS